jgi:nucleoside-diphosphate-sugar epimerase
VELPEALVTIAAHAGELASRVDGRPRLMNRQKAKMSAQEAWLCAGEKAARQFGFECRISQDEGIARTHAWYRERGWY